MSEPRKPDLQTRFAAARRLDGQTMHQWAEAHGVTHTTVYRAINGDTQIPGPTRARLVKAVELYVRKFLRAA